MFNVGGGELLVIMVLALIVLGPKRLPDAARQVGKVMGDLRRLSTGFQNEVRSALDTVDDLDQVTARRNVLAKEEPPAAPPPAPHPVRTEPLVAGPGLEPRPNGASGAPAKARPPSAQARAAAKKQAAAKPPTGDTAKKSSAKNGTPVEQAGKKAPSKAAPRHTT